MFTSPLLNPLMGYIGPGLVAGLGMLLAIAGVVWARALQDEEWKQSQRDGVRRRKRRRIKDALRGARRPGRARRPRRPHEGRPPE